jgi:HEAT repeat protein
MSAPGKDLDEAIGKLSSLHDGDLSVNDVVACGKAAIPELKKILFKQEKSGLYHIRCRAAEALALLGAMDVLTGFLGTERVITDSVERLGEDAVINAVARLLQNVRDPCVFAILLRLGHHAHLTSVIGALGASGRPEAIPAIIAALEEDGSRPTAEAALRSFGRRTGGALLNAATMQLPSRDRESQSSVRRRQSALGLLAEIGVKREAWANLRHLVDDPDARVATLACEIGLQCATATERSRAVKRLIDFLVHPDWLRREHAERVLLSHFSVTRGPIVGYLRENQSSEHPTIRQIEAALRRILARRRDDAP